MKLNWKLIMLGVLLVCFYLCTVVSAEKTWLEKGNEYSAAKDYMGALNCYNKAIEENSKEKIAYIFRAGIYEERLNDYPAAISDYTKALEIGPQVSMMYISRAKVYEKNNQLNEAIDDYTMALSIAIATDSTKHYVSPVSVIYHKRAKLYNRVEKYENAIDDYTQEINFYEAEKDFAYQMHRKARADAYCGRGQARLSMGQLAIDDFSKAIEFAPDNVAAYQGRAICYKALGKQDLYEADFASVTQLESKRK